jgi:hypothetical protein
LEDSVAVEVRHHQVEDHDIRRPGLEDLEGRLAVLGLADDEAIVAESKDQHRADVRVIVDDQDLRHGHGIGAHQEGVERDGSFGLAR